LSFGVSISMAQGVGGWLPAGGDRHRCTAGELQGFEDVQTSMPPASGGDMEQLDEMTVGTAS
jgi:hypothetical protein